MKILVFLHRRPSDAFAFRISELRAGGNSVIVQNITGLENDDFELCDAIVIDVAAIGGRGDEIKEKIISLARGYAKRAKADAPVIGIVEYNPEKSDCSIVWMDKSFPERMKKSIIAAETKRGATAGDAAIGMFNIGASNTPTAEAKPDTEAEPEPEPEREPEPEAVRPKHKARMKPGAKRRGRPQRRDADETQIPQASDNAESPQ